MNWEKHVIVSDRSLSLGTLDAYLDLDSLDARVKCVLAEDL